MIKHRWAAFKRASRVVSMLLKTGLAARKASPERSVGYSDWLDVHVANHPDQPALIGETGRFTWLEMDEAANRVANWAVSLGLGRGDVVALSMENRPEFIVTWLGLSKIGVVTALLNTNLTGERLAHCLREADTKHWIVSGEMLEACVSALGELEEQPQIYRTGMAEAGVVEPEGCIDLDTILAEQASTPVDPAVRANRKAGDGLFFIYTSGTTGLPKAARISHYKALVTGIGSRVAQQLDSSDRVYCCLPLYHTAGGVMAVGGALLSGGTLVIAKRFSAKRFWSDCAQNDVTSIQYIGELCRYLLNSPQHPDERGHRIRVALGNGLRPEIWQAFQDRFGIGQIVEFYGATEGNFALVNFSGRVGAVGELPGFMRKALGVELLRFDVENEEIVRGADGSVERCAPNEQGELLIRIGATTRFEGYTNSEATEKKILRDAFAPGDAYFRTGDLLRVDEDDFFYFVDRIGDTFRWKGENVSTNEVAEVISVAPHVHEANVYGVEIKGMDGRAGMAALVVEEGFDLADLGRRIEAELAVYARPTFIRILPQMEITGTFKHRKVDLVREGFDPRVLSDALYYRNPETGAYAPLDTDALERIEAGQIRL